MFFKIEIEFSRQTRWIKSFPEYELACAKVEGVFSKSHMFTIQFSHKIVMRIQHDHASEWCGMAPHSFHWSHAENICYRWSYACGAKRRL